MNSRQTAADSVQGSTYIGNKLVRKQPNHHSDTDFCVCASLRITT